MTTSSVKKPTTRANWRSLLVFLLLCFAVFVFGGLFQPGEWYLSINKAPWTPPNFVFPIVWSGLYICIALAGWQIFFSEYVSLKALWLIQLLLNGLWSWLFFGQHWVSAALIDIIFIDILVINLILKTNRANLKLASVLLLPYIAWLLLATSLNTYIMLAN